MIQPLAHSCHVGTDRWVSQQFNSNHINPPLGTVGVSSRQPLSQPLYRSMRPLLVYWKSLRDTGINEWLQSSQKCHSVLLNALCKDIRLWAQNRTTLGDQVQAIYILPFLQIICRRLSSIGQNDIFMSRTLSGQRSYDSCFLEAKEELICCLEEWIGKNKCQIRIDRLMPYTTTHTVIYSTLMNVTLTRTQTVKHILWRILKIV